MQRAARTARTWALACAALAAATPALAAPSWWHIVQGKSEVWLIGTPNEAPKGFSWDTSGVAQRLNGASQLIVEPQAKNSLAVVGDLFGAARGLHSDQPLETTLPPPLRVRFIAARTSIGQGPNKYAGWKPTAAGVLLTQDYLKAQNLTAGEIMKTVRQLARHAGVKEQPAGYYEGVPVIAAAEQLSSVGQQVCLSATLHQIELGANHVRAVAQDWSRGVIHPNPTDPADAACFAVMPALKTLNDRLIGEEAQAIFDALHRPGRSVAVFDLGATVMPGGVLDRLRAKGVSIPAPGQ
jgi:uncharacterized protein YbaP (TraB family)